MRPVALQESVRIGGFRRDGVVLVDVGGGLGVLVNLHDGGTSKAYDFDWLLRVYGPFSTVDHPTRDFRAHVQDLVANARTAVNLDAWTPSTEVIAAETTPPSFTRQELVDLLQSANLQVDDYLPEQPTMADDQDFMNTCTSQIVPQMQAAGIQVADANVFCSALYLQRTGMMPCGVPYETNAEFSTPPAEMSMPEEIPPSPPPSEDMVPPREGPSDLPALSDDPASVISACGTMDDKTAMAADAAVGAEPAPATVAIGKPHKKRLDASQTIGKPKVGPPLAAV